MDSLEQLKKDGIIDLISQLGKLTDEELEVLVQANETGIVGIAQDMESIINEIANVGLTILFIVIAVFVINWIVNNDSK